MEKILEKINKFADDGELVSRFWTKIGLMAEITAIFRDAPPDRALFKKVLDLIQRVVPYNAASLFLFSSKYRDLVEIIKIGGGTDLSGYSGIEPNFKDWAILQSEPVKLAGNGNGDRATLAYVVPLAVEKNMIGVVVYVVAQAADLRDQDYKLLSIISDQLALSIERLIYQKRLEERSAALARAHEQLKAIQNDMIQNEKLSAVRELAVSINHEINNPLSVITGNVEYLMYVNKNLDNMTKGRLQIIANEAVRIADINRRLLDIQTLVSENYLGECDKIKMINLEKSTSGEINDQSACGK